MIKYIIIFMFLAFADVNLIFSQTDKDPYYENNKINVMVKEIPELFIEFTNLKPFSFNGSRLLPSKNENKNFMFSGLKAYPNLRPFVIPYIGMLKNNPLASDFNKTQINVLSVNNSVSSNGQKVTYPGLGEYILLKSSFNWRPLNNYSIAITGFLGRRFNFLNASWQNITGTGIKTHYSITDRIYFNIWGRYFFIPDENNFSPGSFNLFPQSGFGSSVSLKVKKQSLIEGAIEYRFNESKREYEMESKGSFKIGF